VSKLSRTLGYAASCFALAASGVVASWPFLEATGRAGVVAAALVSLPLQIGAFAALRANWRNGARFLMVWIGGTVLRLVAVCTVVALVLFSELPPAPTLLALVAFFFGMLLIEPLFLPTQERHTV